MAIRLEKINYIYSPGTAYEKHALKDIDLEIPDGQFLGIIGHTGSGKSTLIQHLNGLIKATSGKLYYNGENIYDEGFNLTALRSQVGLVFQYPEYQLFEADVFTDVCFGPRIWDFRKKNVRFGRKKRWNWSDFRRSIIISRRSSFPADRNGVRRSQAYWQCARKYSCWMNRRRDWIRKVGMRFWSRSAICMSRRTWRSCSYHTVWKTLQNM